MIEKQTCDTLDNIDNHCLAWRGISLETVCPKCSGVGKYTYPNTTTWAGGIGGQALTVDVCDQCWGTGDTLTIGADLRKLYQRIKELEQR